MWKISGRTFCFSLLGLELGEPWEGGTIQMGVGELVGTGRDVFQTRRSLSLSQQGSEQEHRRGEAGGDRDELSGCDGKQETPGLLA